jgi:putative hydroxymethylpyrimidine transport system ATP-binding protein
VTGIGLSGTLWLGDKPLIRDLDLTLPEGGWSVLLGASGAGKTSLGRIVAGLPCAARLDGGVLQGGAPLPPGQVAVMAQDDQLLPWASALDNVTIGARLRGERPEPGRAAALLERVGLGAMAGRRPAALSAGQRQRVALARTLYEARPVVVLDEPFSALDVVTRHGMQALAARELAGRTVLLITHDPAEAVRLAHAAWVLTPEGARPVALPPEPPPRAADALATLDLQARLLRDLTGAAQPWTECAAAS